MPLAAGERAREGDAGVSLCRQGQSLQDPHKTSETVDMHPGQPFRVRGNPAEAGAEQAATVEAQRKTWTRHPAAQ